MLPRTLIAVGVAGACLAIAPWLIGLFPLAAQDVPPSEGQPEPRPASAAPALTAPGSVGQALYPPLRPERAAPAARPHDRRPLGNPIVIANSRLALPPYSKVDVPAQREGVLKFLGVEVRPGEAPPPDVFEIFVGPERKEKTLFRHLREGDRVQAGELLGRVDDTIALADLRIKEAKVTAAVADRISSERT